MRTMKAHDLDTPCLLLDVDIMQSNIDRMAAAISDSPAGLRPHFKTPKTPEVARRQIAAGAIGITVAKLGEAEVLVDAGIGPILMANQVVGARKIDRLMALLARGADITVAVESDFNVRELAEGRDRSGQVPSAIIEVDSGMHRCGTSETSETVRLARLLQAEGIRYRGIMGYEGHAVMVPEEAERQVKARAALAVTLQHAEALAEAGLPAEIVSVAGTGTFEVAANTPGITELEAGSYVFMDGKYQEVMPGRFGCALTLLTTVISVRERYAVCDAGMKSLTNEFGPPMSKDGTLKVARLSEEHAFLTGEGVSALRPGDKVEIIPSHGDTTLNLHDVYHVVSGDELIDEWPILGARKFK
jgi:D-threonine aldolase